MSSDNPNKRIKVAVIGGGCAAITTAFELSRPEHDGRYDVTVYQLGWRLGGKAASGRGAADRIEEHGLHIWMGCYDNAFQLLRECYRELGRDPATSRFADWRDAFIPDPVNGVADRRPNGEWLHWMATFPPADGTPGDPVDSRRQFDLTRYMARSAGLLRTLFESAQERQRGGGAEPEAEQAAVWPLPSLDRLIPSINDLLAYGQLATMATLVQAVELLRMAVQSLSFVPENLLLRLVDSIAAGARSQLEGLVEEDDGLRRLWIMADFQMAILRGIIRFGLLGDPRGFEAINDYDFREWLRMNGASELTLDSGFVRALYDLFFGYEDGVEPRRAAGEALRGTLRMYFTYQGAFYWKMRAGMGDVVFAPFYEVLKRRGVKFRFFHRLENVVLAGPSEIGPGERPWVEALKFDVQARTKNRREYRPLVDVRGLPCWPSAPDYAQLVDGARLREEGRDFESFWDQRKAGSKTLKLGRDFDLVVLGVGLGAVPHVCREIVDRVPRWRSMVDNVKTVATQAFQLWMSEAMEELGWEEPPINLSGFVQPFAAFADMRQLIPEENWPYQPRTIAYFCSALPTPVELPGRDQADYPRRQYELVRKNSVRFLERDVGKLWPGWVRDDGTFRWELLVEPGDKGPLGKRADSARFDTQFWTANVNPSDRYTLSVPGSSKHRLSPLDSGLDNLTVTGDWTDCGYNEGCVESAVMSGRLAAHAICRSPRLADIVGFDHP